MKECRVGLDERAAQIKTDVALDIGVQKVNLWQFTNVENFHLDINKKMNYLI